MDHEAFVLANGESFSVWDVSFGPVERRDESAPCQFQEPDGKIREGTIYYTVESADVSFSAFAGALRVDQAGQISSPNDQFFEVVISSIQAAGNHVRLSGRACKKSDYRREP
jgi:hypothetical protein